MFVVAVAASQPLMGWIDVGEWTGLSARGWAAAVYLATVGQLLPMWLWAMALRRLPASTVAFYQFLMMTLAGTWGWLLRSEPMVWVDVVGIALVACGLALNARRARKGDAEARPAAVEGQAEAEGGVGTAVSERG
jgi:drug/metabolite transporter (DMT)-like permease